MHDRETFEDTKGLNEQQKKYLNDALQPVCEEIGRRIKEDGFITYIEVNYLIKKTLGFDICFSDEEVRQLADYCSFGYTVNPLGNLGSEEA